MVSSDFCMSSKFVLESCIFDNISKQLQVDNEGVLVTHCFVQNPPLVHIIIAEYINLGSPAGFG